MKPLVWLVEAPFLGSQAKHRFIQDFLSNNYTGESL